MRTLCIKPVNQAIGMISTVLRSRQKRKLHSTRAVERIDPSAYTQFVATQYPRMDDEYRLRMRSFGVDENTKENLEAAITKAPKGKVTGSDAVFVLAAEWLEQLWRRCGEHGIFPTEWSRSVLCPLLKKQPATEFQNWRAISLLSHLRKVIKKRYRTQDTA